MCGYYIIFSNWNFPANFLIIRLIFCTDLTYSYQFVKKNLQLISKLLLNSGILEKLIKKTVLTEKNIG